MKKDPSDILKKVKQLEIKTRRSVNEIFSGEYRSVFKGQGVEFSEVREYFPGDDIRSIDWNVTARMGHPFVKKFMEERQLNVLLMVDLSASENFGSHDRFKSEIVAEIAAVLIFSAIRNNDRVGLLTFTDQIELYLPPKKGRQYGMRMIREILYRKPRGKGTNLAQALEHVVKAIRRRCIVFLISDFLDQKFEKPLRIAAKKHDLVAIEIRDPLEESFPALGLIALEDAETGKAFLVNTKKDSFINFFKEKKDNENKKLRKLFQAHRIDRVQINTHTSYAKPLNQLFKTREKRLRS